MHDFSHYGERPDGSRSDAWGEQQFWEIGSGHDRRRLPNFRTAGARSHHSGERHDVLAFRDVAAAGAREEPMKNSRGEPPAPTIRGRSRRDPAS